MRLTVLRPPSAEWVSPKQSWHPAFQPQGRPRGLRMAAMWQPLGLGTLVTVGMDQWLEPGKSEPSPLIFFHGS